MESPLRKRRKILLLFVLGVGLPSLGLGYLAVRGIRNELALLAQRGLAEHRILSQRVADTLSLVLRASEDCVLRSLAKGPGAEAAISECGRTGPQAVQSLGEAGAEPSLVETVFFLDTLGSVQLPWAHPLHLPDRSLSPSSVRSWPAAAASEVQAARKLEFQRRDYTGALAGYRRALFLASDPAHRGEALLAVARVQQKAGQLEAAVATCDTLAEEYGQVRIGTGLLLGPEARLKGSSLLLGMGDTLGSLEALAGLYQDLVQGTWRLERAEYEFLAGETRDSVNSVVARLPAGDRLASLRQAMADLEEREEGSRVLTERQLLFQGSVGSGLMTRVPSLAPGTPVQGFRVTLENAGEVFLVSVPNQVSGPQGIEGLLLDARGLAGLLEETLEALADPFTTEWALRGRDGRSILNGNLLPEGSISLNATFPDNFPPWLLEFHQRPQSPVRLLFASSRSLYSYMFLLIGTILVFGLVLTARTVNQELELARLKSDFLSTVSHEFRSPLTSIRHVAEMLQAGSVPTEERRRRYYDVLVEQSTRLSSLVTNILDLARIEEGRHEFHQEVVDVGEVIEEVVEGARHRVQDEGFVLKTHLSVPLPTILVDRVALGRAVSNLLDNAIRYSRESRHIDVRASADAGYVTLSVVDQGVGIPEQELGRVFDRFFRGGNPLTRSVKGSGLGLALVKEIVEAHGGTVQVQSEVGRGSTFSIRIPLRTE